MSYSKLVSHGPGPGTKSGGVEGGETHQTVSSLHVVQGSLRKSKKALANVVNILPDDKKSTEYTPDVLLVYEPATSPRLLKKYLVLDVSMNVTWMMKGFAPVSIFVRDWG